MQEDSLSQNSGLRRESGVFFYRIVATQQSVRAAEESDSAEAGAMSWLRDEIAPVIV